MRDFIEVRPHPTVVRLDHLEAEDARWISSGYHVTTEVRNHLHALRHALRREAGCGIFVIGQYGSGKSHLLAWIAQNLPRGNVVDTPPGVVSISLVNFGAAIPLEEIVCHALGVDAAASDRRTTWAQVSDRFPHGLLLLIDELSEFLRSKPDRRAFTEDVRFLQFLGEWSQDHRFWPLAAMQEQIEHVGDLDQGVYRKIKDRFPMRFILSSVHVRDLISECIMIRREGYEGAAEKLAQSLRQSFPESPVDDVELTRLAPVHPACLDLLEEIRDRFSQARGAIDFVITRLRGDPAREIPSFLDEPWGALVTPDAIVDHFRDLLEVQSEFAPIASQLFPWFRKNLDAIFPAPAARTLAQRLLKLLVLVHLAPSLSGLSAAQAAYWLLYRASRLDPSRNLDVVAATLQRLADHGRFVTSRDGEFALDLDDDGREGLERLLQREIADLAECGSAVFDGTLAHLEPNGFHPGTLPADTWQSRNVRWHFHPRPYRSWTGSARPSATDGLALWVQLPWSERDVGPGLWTVNPAALELNDEARELAALIRMRERTWNEAAHRFLDARFSERESGFRARIERAYREAVVVDPEGKAHVAPPFEAAHGFDAWLDEVAVWALRRTYPSFARFAPVHGPLPTDAHRSFLRTVFEGDLAASTTDELIPVIREAYLLPMGLMKRKGRDYQLAANLDRNELVRLVLDLVEHQPSPRVLFDHLAQPVYGLVPDQVSLLLGFLVALGEIDVQKGARSIRETFETLPHPLQYDRVVPGRGLDLEQLRALKLVIDGLDVKAPKQWTVAAQREICRRLRDDGQAHVRSLQTLALELERAGRGQSLIDGIQDLIASWNALHEEANEVAALAAFLSGLESPERFAREVSRLATLPDRVRQQLAEVRRLEHLLAHPAVTPWLEHRRETQRVAPEFDATEAVAQWLVRIGALYEEYHVEYQARHDTWAETLSRHPAWTWRPPGVASGKSLALHAQIESLTATRATAEQQRCRGLSSLEYHPLCRCGFDGVHAPLDDTLEAWTTLRHQIENHVEAFFAQHDVRRRVAAAADADPELRSTLGPYLDRDAPHPDITEPATLDRLLGGVDLVQTVDVARLVDVAASRTWSVDDLLIAVRELVPGQSQRVRFVSDPPGRPEVALWCAEQSLRTGTPLPHGLTPGERETLADGVRPEWVGPASVDGLSSLRLPPVLERRIAEWILDGTVDPPSFAATCPVSVALRECTKSVERERLEDHAALSTQLYRAHATVGQLGDSRWLARLDALAERVPSGVPKLVDVLRSSDDASWVLVDALGLPLLEPLRRSLADGLPEWTLESTSWATVSRRTTTDAFYADTAGAGLNHSIHKINGVDELIHENVRPFDDLCIRARAAVSIELKAVRAALDPTRPVIVFADHGFRLNREGTQWKHGGSSGLERLVPVLRFAAR